jgi:enoyl-CoA hydratase/carnithine racemase
VDLARIDVAGTVGVRVITIDHQRRHNALTPDMLQQLAAAFDIPDGVGAVVLCGAGSSFSSGFDRRALTTQTINDDHHPIEAAAVAMERCPVPIIIAAHGNCLGGAMELLACATWVVAHTDVQVGIPAVHIGVVYPPRGVQRMQHAWGRHTATMLLSGVRWGASQALQAGVVHSLSSTPREDAMAMAEQICAAPTKLVRAHVALVHALDQGAQPNDDAVHALRRLAMADETPHTPAPPTRGERISNS